MAHKSNYLENKLTDWYWRGQAFTPPSTHYFALFTVSPSDTGGGTEVSTSGSGYARVGVAASLANFAGTQSAGSTTASSGTGGTTSNNGTITFGAPTSNWGTIVAIGIFDASSGGNMTHWIPLTTARLVNSGDAAPSFAAGSFTFQEDN